MPLPKPVGRQKEVLYLPAQGHTVVLGTAGSGKTTLAILRAEYLAKTFTPPGRKVLLVTFNRALVTYLESLASSQIPNIDVRTYHRFALGYLTQKKNRQISVVPKEKQESLIRAALREARRENGAHPIHERPFEMISTEFEWIAKAGVRTSDAYYKVERVGRSGTRIERKDREALFDVYERYLRLRSVAGYDYSWDDLALAALDEFTGDTSSRLYQHAVVDEGQDFSPVMLRSLVAAVPSGGNLTFFGDVAQQIYGTRISWRSAGLNPPRIWRFEENYRNSKKIAQLGLAISRMPCFQGEVDLVEPREPKADGPLPTMVHCKDKVREFDLALRQAKLMGRTQSVAILMRDRDKEKDFLRKLQAAGVAVQKLHREMSSWSSSSPRVCVGTYYSAKGLEFDAVILPFCSDDVLPDPSRIVALGDENDALSEEGRLLYVAVTRAKARLILTFSGSVTRLLPVDGSLYQRIEES
ncbi:MAG: ATP-dependent helicase [Anaerolineae bacterium]|nr:ATP-dependent helicase [Anaerolineae bacterium]